jgi:hypothetical protein
MIKINELIILILLISIVVWVIIKVYYNSGILSNPFLQDDNKNLIGLYGESYNPFSPLNKCPYCCKNKSGSLKFRAKVPCTKIINDQCNGLDEVSCNINKNLCKWSNNQCTVIDKYPYIYNVCDNSYNYNCDNAVGYSF